MQKVDVLGVDAVQHAARLQSGQRPVHRGGMKLIQPVDELLRPAVEESGILEKTVEREDLLDLLPVPRLKVDAVGSPEIPDSGERGDSGAGEGDGVPGLPEQFPEFVVHGRLLFLRQRRMVGPGFLRTE